MKTRRRTATQAGRSGASTGRTTTRPLSGGAVLIGRAASGGAGGARAWDRTADRTLPGDPAVERQVAVEEEAPQDLEPRAVRVEMVVELRRERLHLGEVDPRNAHQVVVLVVIADVEGDPVQRPVVGVRLLAGDEGVVLLDPARPDDVEPDPEERREHQVREPGETGPAEDERVRDRDRRDVDENPRIDERALDPERTDHLDDRKGEKPERLPDRRATDQVRLPPKGQIRVPVVLVEPR